MKKLCLFLSFAALLSVSCQDKSETKANHIDAARISLSLNTIGSIYVAAKQPEEGLKYLNQTLQFAEQASFDYHIAFTCGSLAETEFAQNHFDEAMRYIDRAISRAYSYLYHIVHSNNTIEEYHR